MWANIDAFALFITRITNPELNTLTFCVLARPSAQPPSSRTP